MPCHLRRAPALAAQLRDKGRQILDDDDSRRLVEPDHHEGSAVGRDGRIQVLESRGDQWLYRTAPGIPYDGDIAARSGTKRGGHGDERAAVGKPLPGPGQGGRGQKGIARLGLPPGAELPLDAVPVREGRGQALQRLRQVRSGVVVMGSMWRRRPTAASV